jgi:hypothetical protein
MTPEQPVNIRPWRSLGEVLEKILADLAAEVEGEKHSFAHWHDAEERNL